VDFKNLEEINSRLKTTDIKGKDYVEVNQRILAFRELFPNGSITTEIISIENGVCTVKATIDDYDDERGDIKTLATGHAQEKEGSTFINKTSYIENCETSAVGRALGLLGIGATTSIASAEEVLNAITNQTRAKTTKVKKENKDIIDILDAGTGLEKIDKLKHDALISAIKKYKLTDEQVYEILQKYGYNKTDEIQIQNYIKIITEFKVLVGGKMEDVA